MQLSLVISPLILLVALSLFLPEVFAQQTVVNPGYGFSWFGCYNEVPPKALSGAYTTSYNMTVEYCASYCQGFNYIGVEGGNSCYCGNTVDPSSQQVTTESGLSCTDGRYTCSGNSSVGL